MVAKPNRSLNRKAVYEEVQIEFFTKTRKIIFVDKNKASEQGTLKEIKWITKNMINIELILGNNAFYYRKRPLQSHQAHKQGGCCEVCGACLQPP